jgi:diguanylate cyclase (GGDEF)-like protein
MPNPSAPNQDELQQTIEELQRAERIQNALYQISDLAGADLETDDILGRLHQIISELMYAENFYIFLYNASQDTVRFRYFADVATKDRPDMAADIPLDNLEHSLTWYVIRLASPLRGSLDAIARELPGPLKALGAHAKDWLGVPILDGTQVKGILAVQSYDQKGTYSKDDQNLLSFVASHILTMLQRRWAKRELEQAVIARTRELAEANRALEAEVAQRRRNERLQKALYHIAEQAGEIGQEKAFFRLVHHEVAELIYAENFFIALLVDDDQALEFGYYADEFLSAREKRPLGMGMTEYALRQDNGVLLTRKDMQKLADEGKALIKGELAHAWMGVPLQCEGKTLGLIVVQSYREDRLYREEDLQLLRFVSTQIASSLERKRALASLSEAKRTLEQRVDERTRELSEANQALATANKALEEQSLTDPLTGLRNRRYLVEQVPTDVALVDRRYRERNHGPSEVEADNVDLLFLMIDIDHFKQINDIYGHAAGDRVLEQMSSILIENSRQSDTAVRWGGEEFLLVARFTDSGFAPTLAERLRQGVADHPFDLGDGRSEKLTCSIGYAQYPVFPNNTRNVHWEEVINLADHCLYAAKQTWRNAWIGVRWANTPPPDELPVRISRALPDLVRAGYLEVHSSHQDASDIEWPADTHQTASPAA